MAGDERSWTRARHGATRQSAHGVTDRRTASRVAHLNPAQEKAIPNVFVKDFQAALAYYTGPLGFHALFVYGAACVLSICSTGVIGTAGLSFLRGTDPVIATETTTGRKGPSTKVH